MVKLVALYKKPEDPAAFDEHYRTTHVPIVLEMPGLRKCDVFRVTGSPLGESEYYLQAEMIFDDMEALKAALMSDAGKASGRDIRKFAGGLITMFFAEEADFGK